MRAPVIPRWTHDVALLVSRLSIAPMMMIGHGLPKLLAFSERAHDFPDPLGAGREVSLALAISAEVGASFFIALGLLTRAAAIPFSFTMLVASIVEPWDRKELVVLYAIPGLVWILCGAGRFSIDGWWSGRRRRSEAARPPGR
jgi:putative oxidoreductase